MKGITKNKNGRFRVDKVYKGIRISTNVTSEKEAIDFIKAKMFEIDKGQDEKERTKNFNNLDFYYKQVVNLKNYAPSTKAKNDGRYYNYIKPHFNKDVTEITNDDLAYFYEHIKKDVQIKKYEAVQANKILYIVRCMVDLINARLNTNLSMKFFTNFKQIKGRTEKLENNFIEYPDFVLLREKILEQPKLKGTTLSPEEFTFVCDILYFTGCRYAEARALTKSDFVIKEGKYTLYGVNITKQYDETINKIVDYTKTKENRFVYLAEDIFYSLIERIKNFDLKDEYIFSFKALSSTYTRKSFGETINKILNDFHSKKILPDNFVKYLSPHGLRFSNGLYLRDILHLSDELSAKNQGHTLSVHLDVYSRVSRLEIEDKFGKSKEQKEIYAINEVVSIKKEDTKVFFCFECGEKITNEKAKFCSCCGTKLA